MSRLSTGWTGPAGSPPLWPGIGLLGVLLLLAGATGLRAAQEEVNPELHGQVLLGAQAVDTATVVLHQVGPESAGPVDSVRVESDGSFRFALPRLPGSGNQRDVFFASVRRYGILYFGSPVSSVSQLDSLYTIQTYETRGAGEGGEQLTITIRNLFINRTEAGWNVTDLFEVQNASDWTWVAEGDEPTWRYPLPEAATNFQVGQGDLGDDAVEFRDGVLHVYAPVPPGERLFVVTYDIPDLNLDVPLPGYTEMVQVLISEPAPPLEAEGLTQERPVEMEPGVQFRRYAAEGVSDQVARLSEGGDAFSVPVRELAVLLALLLTAAAIWALRRDPSASAGPEPVRREDSPAVGELADDEGSGGDREELLLSIARLDEEFESLDRPTDEAKERYRKRREKLLQRLRELG